MPAGKFLTAKEACERGRFTPWFLWRVHRDGEGPPRIKLSYNRYLYPEEPFEQWLLSRLERPFRTQPAE
jgi:hypothetical protein